MTFGVLAAAAASSSSTSDVSAGLVGFVVIAAMGVALFFLLRSMNRQFHKISPGPGPDAGAEDGEEAKDPAEAPK